MVTAEIKNKLRLRFKELRNKQEAPSRDALNNMFKIVIEEIGEAETIFCYVSYDYEVPTHEFIKQLLAAGKTVLVPKCVNDEMYAISCEDFDKLEPSSIGILRPAETLKELQAQGRVYSKEKIDVAIVPILAFYEMFRLGYGGGNYDKFLKNTKIKKIGIAHEFSKTEIDFSEPHDVPMDVIVATNGEIYRKKTV
ncbi:MAG: 5-formyltetrahydrofolate cyclo-ligase [Firmicutes bacterium]|nr:5-formyltetrahydrofolate cyclo-ligase [Bacillota bacterium]MCL2771503.1 5-formyltetrahydrofolate cyclo-ligase [Bacillota bacterium]